MSKKNTRSKKKTIVMVTGGFDPLHIGHLKHFQKAKKLGDVLVVAVDGDDFLIKKKGAAFMPIKDRAAIISELRCVDKVVVANEDNVSKVILKVRPDIIAKGGDRVKLTDFHPKEQEAIAKVGAKVIFGIGGKLNSSSDLLKRWVDLKTRT